MNQRILSNNNGRIMFGTILWIIAIISFCGVLMFSIGLFQMLSEGFSDEFVRLEILVVLLGILNASSISGSIFIVSQKE